MKVVKKVTRKDVALRAGVSEQTVSYIFNKKRKFSDNLVKKVMQAVEDLQYKPNMLATSLKTNITKTICLVVEDITNPVFSEIMLGFEHSAVDKGYFISLIHAKNDYENLARNLIARSFDGIYLSLLPSENVDDFIQTMVENDIKVVLGNKMEFADPMINTSYVEVDTYSGVKEIIRYLYGLGHKKIAYLSGLDVNDPLDKRYQGFLDGMREIVGETHPYCEESSYPFETSSKSGYKLAKSMLNNYSPTAVIATNDLMALGAMTYIKEKGILIPEEISVVGIDDTAYCEYSTPKLTSLGFDKEEYGKLLFHSLFSQLEEDGLKNGSVCCHITERDSVCEIKNRI